MTDNASLACVLFLAAAVLLLCAGNWTQYGSWLLCRRTSACVCVCVACLNIAELNRDFTVKVSQRFNVISQLSCDGQGLSHLQVGLTEVNKRTRGGRRNEERGEVGKHDKGVRKHFFKKRRQGKVKRNSTTKNKWLWVVESTEAEPLTESGNFLRIIIGHQPVEFCRLDVHQVERFTAGEQQEVRLKNTQGFCPIIKICCLLHEAVKSVGNRKQWRKAWQESASRQNDAVKAGEKRWWRKICGQFYSQWQTGCFPAWWCLPPGRPSISHCAVCKQETGLWIAD